MGLDGGNRDRAVPVVEGAVVGTVVEAPNVNAVEAPPNRGVDMEDVELFWFCLEKSGGEGELENMESDLVRRPVVAGDNV